jgi:hypothetical protein
MAVPRSPTGAQSPIRRSQRGGPQTITVEAAPNEDESLSPVPSREPSPVPLREPSPGPSTQHPSQRSAEYGDRSSERESSSELESFLRGFMNDYRAFQNVMLDRLDALERRLAPPAVEPISRLSAPPRRPLMTPNPSVTHNSSVTPGPPSHYFCKEPKLPDPPGFMGNVSEFRNFIAQCKSVIKLRPTMFTEDEFKVLYILSFFRGSAQDWALAIMENEEHPLRFNYENFLAELYRTYNDRTTEETAMNNIANLKQTHSVADYAARFQSLAAILDIDDKSKVTFFYNGLKSHIKRAITDQGNGIPRDYTELSNKAISIDQNRFMIEKHDSKRPSGSTSSAPSSSKITTQSSESKSSYASANSSSSHTRKFNKNRGPLTQEERDRRRKLGLCSYCGDKGHTIHDCLKAAAQKELMKRAYNNATSRVSSATPAPSYTAAVSLNQSSTIAAPIPIHPGNFQAQSSARREL